MKKNLTKKEYRIYYIKDGVRIKGVHSKISGYVSNISGDVSGIKGDVSSIRGDVSGIEGDVSGIRVDLNTCVITEEDRENGIDIEYLIN